MAAAFEMTSEKLKTYLYGDSTLTPKSDDEIFSSNLINESKYCPCKFADMLTPALRPKLKRLTLELSTWKEIRLAELKRWKRFLLLNLGDSLKGDNINNGDIVVIEPHPDLIEGKIYIIRLDNEVVARHVHRENGFAVLTSSNGKYARIEVDKLEVIGRVIGA